MPPRRPRLPGEINGELTDLRRRDSGDAGDSFRRIAGDESAQLVDVLAVALNGFRIETHGTIDLMQQRRQQVGVAVRPDLEHLPGNAGRFDLSRVDVKDSGPALLRFLQVLHGVRNRYEGHVAHRRVLADDENEVAVIDVWYRVHGPGAEHGLAAGELVGAVLGA